MKRLWFILICASVVSPALHAQAPSNMTYQGLLTTSSGVPLQDGSYVLRFDLFSTSNGGISLWSEVHSAVAIQRGVFAVVLGATTPFYAGNSDSAFIEVTVQSGPGISSPYVFFPRTVLTSVPFAHKSDTAAVALVAPPGGTAGGDLTGVYPNPAIGNNAVTGAKILDSTITGADINSGSALRVGSVATSGINVTGGITLTNTINPSNYGTVFDGGGLVVTSGNNNPIYFYTTDAERVRITQQGRVGIGTPDPGAMLDVAGAIRLTNTGTPSSYGALWDGGGLVLSSGNNNPLALYTADVERMRITPEGRMGIGTSSPTTALEVTGRIKDKTGFLSPAGAIVMYGGPSAPEGWLLCDGSTKSAIAYPELFAAIGYAFGGSGDDFNLPDMRQRFPLGSSTGATGETGGTNSFTLALGNLPAHSHLIDLWSGSSGHNHGFQGYTSQQGSHPGHMTGAGGGLASGSGSYSQWDGLHSHYFSGSTDLNTHAHQIYGNTTETGSGNPVNYTPPYLVMNYIIKY
jgi:microcystin-dependent protein